MFVSKKEKGERFKNAYEKEVFLLAKLLVLTSALLVNFVPIHKSSAETGNTRLYSISTIVSDGIEITDHWQSHASNNSWYQINVTGGPAWYRINVEMIFSTTVDPTTLANITVFSEAHVTDVSNPVDIKIYDYVSGVYVPALSVSATTDTNHTQTFTTNLSNYINTTTAEMKLQVYYKVKALQSIYQDHTYIELFPKFQPPVASFTWEPVSPMVGEAVSFNASTSYDPDGNITNWDWDFGDGNIGSGEITAHVYTAAGDYSVTLTVTDNDGVTGTSIGVITVRDFPVASFTYSLVAPGIVNFDASASQPDGGELIDPDSYFWDFGDTTTGNGKTVNHTYAAVGTYNVTLTVTDTTGLSDSTWQLINVSDWRDVAIVSVVLSDAEVYPTWSVPVIFVNVTVVNEGDFTESFNVTVYYNVTAADWVAVGTLTVTGLASGDSAVLTFSWDFSGVTPPLITILKAEAVLIDAVDSDPADNTFTDGTVYVKKPGDADGSVGILDAGLVSAHCIPVRPSDP